MTNFIVSSSRFVFRTPLLSFDEILSWSRGLSAAACIARGDDETTCREAFDTDVDTLRRDLRTIVERREVIESIFVASPSLTQYISMWMLDPSSKRAQKVERSLVKYLLRMATRATPFGLFSGCSVGAIGADTKLLTKAASSSTRRTRLDMDYLCELTEALKAEPELRRVMTIRPNDSLYRALGQLRYVEGAVNARSRTYRLSAITADGYLEAALRRAEHGARFDQIVESILATDADGDIGRLDAEQFVEEMIDNQVLVVQLAPPVTGVPPVLALTHDLEVSDAGRRAAALLRSAQEAMTALDAEGIGASVERYERIAESLRGLPAKPELRRLFQVDLFKPSPDARLGEPVIAAVLEGLDVLYALSRFRFDDPLSRFRKDFAERYGEREVPLRPLPRIILCLHG